MQQMLNTFGMRNESSFSELLQEEIQEMANDNLEAYMNRLRGMNRQRQMLKKDRESLLNPQESVM